MDQGRFLFLDGKFLPSNKAVISPDNRSFRYGDGFFATIKCNNGKLQLETFHLERITDSLRLLQFQPPAYFQGDFIRESIVSLLRKNVHKGFARVRCTIFRGDGGIYDAQNHFPHLMIQSWPLSNESNQLNINGLDIGIYPNAVKAVDDFSGIKSNNYLPYTMGAIWAKQQHLNDALILNSNGMVADATIANIFLVYDGQLITPPLSDGPVAGVMRRAVLHIAKEFGIAAEERSILPSELLVADEVFLTNAIYGLKWVKLFGEKHYHQALAQSFFKKIQLFFLE